MIRFIYNSFTARLAAGLLAGIIGYFLVEVVFSLQYRYYSPFSRLPDYLFAMAFGFAILESMVRINEVLDSKVPWDPSPLKRFLYQALFALGIALLIVSVIRPAIILFLMKGRLLILADELVIFLVTVFLVGAFSAAELGIFLNRKYRDSLAELERFRKENVEYQFEMLKLQLNPHFLFNSLNTLSSLVYEDPAKASDFIRRLSDVYRYVLDNRNQELVTLGQEMDFISSFTFLLGIRFQGMVTFRLDIGKESLSKQIAPMTIQLLVENAVKHNIASKQKPLEVDIFTRDGYVWVTNRLQLKEGATNTGVGLKNIASRYGFLTERKVEVIREEEFFKVKIPLL